MPDLSLILFDDATARSWEPFALTRPVGELLLGALTFRERAERVCGARCTAQLSAEHLHGFQEDEGPPVVGLEELPRGGARLFLSSRVVLEWNAPSRWTERPDRPGPIVVEGQTVGWYAPDGAAAPGADFFLRPEEGTTPDGDAAPLELPGRMLERVWELVSENPEQITRDIEALFPAAAPADLPEGVYQLGEHPVVLGADVRLEPGVVLDTMDGPIWLDDEVVVHAFTRLTGPCYVGRESTLMGGPVCAVSVGPCCKVRGEILETVCLGYTNKQHSGHMGHAYLGRWVNIGAETTNSDLKNNYGTIRMWTPEGAVDTGLTKLGSLLGDHVKTGIGLLLNTGTVIGAGSNLYGAAMPPTFVPPFSWGTGDELVAFRVDKFLEVAERAMERRDVELTPTMRELLQRAWERGRAQAEEEATAE